MTDMLGNWMLDTIHCTDALTLLQGLPDNSVNCAITSPPYFNLRDYQTEGQIGLEATPREYVAALVAVFREVRRVLRDDGTFWLNLGDSYASDSKWGGATGGKHAAALHGSTSIGRERRDTGIADKNLLMIPARVALALQADGWILRQDIIWHTPNAMPESVTDRPTLDYEHVFLLAKSARYWYDATAIREPGSTNSHGGGNPEHHLLLKATIANGGTSHSGLVVTTPAGENGRNRRSVWSINTESFPGAHYAVMPEALVEPCVLAGCPETVCAVCGAPHVRQVERERLKPNAPSGNREKGRFEATKVIPHNATAKLAEYFAPTCTCNGGTTNGVVLDCFGGAATVGVVAKRLNRRYLLSEINPAYVELARDRLAGVTPMFPGFAQVIP